VPRHPDSTSKPTTALAISTFSLFATLLATLLLTPSSLLVSRAQQLPQPPSIEPKTEPPVSEAQISGYTIQRNVDLIVLHVSVVDEHGQFVPGLTAENFRIFEDRVEQRIAVARQEDVPVSIGLMIDDSGSMSDKRPQVNAAALSFVKSSHPDDEVFVSRFNDGFHAGEFSSDISELNNALEHSESRGSTALFDAIVASLDHLKRGYRDKKVLLLISDGEDNASRANFQFTMQAVQKTSAMIYSIGLLGQEAKSSAERARQALVSLTQVTGGATFFPEDVQDVERICSQIARDIRHQYTLEYYPTNAASDGTFRSVRVEIISPPGSGRISHRARTGYFARKSIAAK